MIPCLLVPKSFVNTCCVSNVSVRLPGDCFLDLVWPSPNLLLCAVELFLTISSFSLYFSSSLYSCLSISDWFLFLFFFTFCASFSEKKTSRGGGVRQDYMIIHLEKGREFFFHSLSPRSVCLSVIKFISAPPPLPRDTDTWLSSESCH